MGGWKIGFIYYFGPGVSRGHFFIDGPVSGGSRHGRLTLPLMAMLSHLLEEG
jgi:hypothetical protein